VAEALDAAHPARRRLGVVQQFETEALIDLLRRGKSVALVADRDAAIRRRALRSAEDALAELGRTVLWIDLEGAASGAELGGRIVEACMPELDAEHLSDLLEGLPARGRLDLEAFAELLMLPELVATSRGRRVVAILDGFEVVERVIGFDGLSVVRDALLMRDQVAYLFVGSPRLAGLFGRPRSPLFGMAEVIVSAAATDRRAGRAAEAVASSPESTDPLVAALLGWANPMPKPSEKLVIAREMPSPAELAWERFMARERRERDDWEDDEDGPDRRPRRPGRRR
jgi:hypothetical protein